MACSAGPHDGTASRIDTYAPAAWARTSNPQNAVRSAGMGMNSTGSSMHIDGAISWAKLANLWFWGPVVVSVTTNAKLVSDPVPAVVDTAMCGGSTGLSSVSGPLKSLIVRPSCAATTRVALVQSWLDPPPSEMKPSHPASTYATWASITLWSFGFDSTLSKTSTLTPAASTMPRTSSTIPVPRSPVVISSTRRMPSCAADTPIISCAPGPSKAAGVGWMFLIGKSCKRPMSMPSR
ncbi:MAG: hypothetical protein QM733_17615 [Ilumatobacteraceae bacterium]